MKRILFFLMLAIFVVSCKDATRSSYRQTKGFVQGTTYSIIYDSSEDLNTQIAKELKQFNKSLSIFDSTSVISKVNRNESVVLDSNFLVVFRRAMEISIQTEGAFDITVSPMVKLWGFYSDEQKSVTQHLIDSVRMFVGYEKATLVDNRIEKSDSRVQLDANAIAQGYSCDVIAHYFDKLGIENYMIEIGGEIRTKGLSERGEAWRVGIQKPVVDTIGQKSEILAIVALSGQSIGTSGNYRKFRIIDGKQYGHEIDPRTGFPVQHNLLSVTIVAKDAISADAYATACMVMGLEKSVELISSLDGVEGYFVYDDKGEQRVKMTENFPIFVD